MTLRKSTLISLCLIPMWIQAQEKDAGLWVGGSARMDVGRKLEAGIDPEIRLDENMTRVQGFFSDFSLSREISDYFGAQVEYRLGGRRVESWYEQRHRFSLGLSARKKWGEFSTVILFRRQMTPVIGSSGDGDVDLRSVSRLRGKIGYGGIKKIDLSTSLELFFDNRFSATTDWRWQAEVEYKLSKRRFLSAGYLIQKDLSDQSMDFVVRMSYTWLIDLDGKKKKEKSGTSTEELPR